MAKTLTENGLTYLWGKIKDFVAGSFVGVKKFKTIHLVWSYDEEGEGEYTRSLSFRESFTLNEFNQWKNDGWEIEFELVDEQDGLNGKLEYVQLFELFLLHGPWYTVGDFSTHGTSLFSAMYSGNAWQISGIPNNLSIEAPSYDLLGHRHVVLHGDHVNNNDDVDVTDAAKVEVNGNGVVITTKAVESGGERLPLTFNGNNVATDNNVVHKSGNETITGTKTFNGDCNFNGNLVWQGSLLEDVLDDKANNNEVVHTTGNEDISGNKTFNGDIIMLQGFRIYNDDYTDFSWITDSNGNTLQDVLDGISDQIGDINTILEQVNGNT